MNDFEERFTQFFYQQFLTIISDSSKLDNAVAKFQQSCINTDSNRFLCKEKFGLQKWEDIDAAKFSGAAAEALFLTTQHFLDQPRMLEIHTVSNNIQENILPALAKKVGPDNPFLKLSKEILSSSNDLRESRYNRNQFFAIGAAVIVALTVTAAVAVGANQSK